MSIDNHKLKLDIVKKIISSLICKKKSKLYEQYEGEHVHVFKLITKDEIINIGYEILFKIPKSLCGETKVCTEITIFSKLFGYSNYCYDISKKEYLSIKENIINDL